MFISLTPSYDILSLLLVYCFVLLSVQKLSKLYLLVLRTAVCRKPANRGRR